MMTYEWEYGIPSGELVRIKNRLDQMSRFSDEDGRYRIIMFSAPKNKNANLEFDGKAIFNKREGVGYTSYLSITFYYVLKDGSEDKFIQELSDDLKKKYFAIQIENIYSADCWSEYYELYTASGQLIEGV